MRRVVKFLDPKLEKYRVRRSAPKKEVVKYSPKSLEEFVDVIRRAPKTVLSASDRKRIAAVMSFDARTVGELMVPKSKMVFVSSDEMLGPLVLDKLYKSGFTNFPIVDTMGKVKGIINTESLNNLEVRKMEEAKKYADKKIQYLKMSDSLRHAIEEIGRTNSYYYLVVDAQNELVGFLTAKMIFDYLLGKS